jgi:DNA-binding response OmpR family regulator
VKKVRILLVEDDELFNETLRDYLEDQGFAVQGGLDAKSAVELCYYQRFDLYLFDINLPFENGYSLLDSLRSGGDDTPTIFLTSRDDRLSLLHGLRVGADDYLRKPVDLEELLLRIHAILRRAGGSDNYRVGEYEIDLARRKILKGEEEVEIGRKVFDLLALLLKAGGNVVTTEEIGSALWTTAEETSYGAIRVYITQLKKLFGTRIENLRGVGYRFIMEKSEESKR